MKRQAGRETTSSPPRGLAKRIRERDRDRGGGESTGLPPHHPPLPPLALLLAESRGSYRGAERDKPRTLPRLERGEPRDRDRDRERSVAMEIHHHRHHELGLLGRAPLRTSAVVGSSSLGATVGPSVVDLPAARPGTLEYKTLLISNLGSQVSDEDVEDALFHEFKKFGDVSVKLSHTPELGRIAYVNFRHTEDAKEARHAKSSRLVLGDRQLKIEPMYVRRRSVTPPPEVIAGGYLPLHTHAPPYPPPSYRQRSLSPPLGPHPPSSTSISSSSSSSSSLRAARHYTLESLGISRERERILDYYGMLDERGRPYGFTPMPVVEDLKPEDDQRATSNLFIGNLDGNVAEAELRRGFDKYGVIEDVVIKRPSRGQGGAYAFVKFQNLDMAHRAKVAMQGRLLGGNPIKIGYGKANPTTRLWVGGLGPGNSLAALAREFDRFGSIRNIDYAKGESFAYIQYESLDASQAACTQMRGFPLGGPERRLRVDFAKVEEIPARPFPPGYQPTIAPVSAAHFDILGDVYSRHRSLERELRGVRDLRGSPPSSSSSSHGLLSQRERDRERERAVLERERERERDFPAGSPTRSLLERRAGGGGGGGGGAVEAFGGSRNRGARSRSRSRERWLKEREESRRNRRRGNSRSPSSPETPRLTTMDERDVVKEKEKEKEKEREREMKEKEKQLVGNRLRMRGVGGGGGSGSGLGLPGLLNKEGLSPDASPDRGTARVRAPDSTTEPRSHSPDNNNNLQGGGGQERGGGERGGGGGHQRHSNSNSNSNSLLLHDEDSHSGRQHYSSSSSNKRSSSNNNNDHHHLHLSNNTNSNSNHSNHAKSSRNNDSISGGGGGASSGPAGASSSSSSSPARLLLLTNNNNNNADSGHHMSSSSTTSNSAAGAGATSCSQPGSLTEYAQMSLSKSWHGFFALKNSSFPTDLFLLEGGPAFFNATMRESLKVQQGKNQKSHPSTLKIAQRLRMDQSRLDEVSRRVKLGRPDSSYCVLLALQGPVDRHTNTPEHGLQVRLLRHLVTYLRNKEAAGVVSLPACKEGLPGAMLYAFPPGDFSQQFLHAPKRIVGNLDEEHMVIVIVTDTS